MDNVRYYRAQGMGDNDGYHVSQELLTWLNLLISRKDSGVYLERFIPGTHYSLDILEIWKTREAWPEDDEYGYGK